MSLEGPILLIDPKTRQIVTNSADGEGALAKDGQIYRGQFPPDGMFGNTATDWKSVRWTMLMWPLSGNKHEVARILMHESFHRIQPMLSWPMKGVEAPHLAVKDARILLQLEYRALAKALDSAGKEMEVHVQAALAFRARRWSLYKGAAASENDLELIEGIAEYTGLKLSGERPKVLCKNLAERMKSKEGANSYSRSFCYETGPAYALLLDARTKTWRDDIRKCWNLTELAAKAYGITIENPTDGESRRLAERYEVQPLEKREAKLGEERQARILHCRKLFVEGPTIELRLKNPSISFNPTNLFPLGAEGTVYPTMGVSDVWGKLEVKSGGALMKDWKVIRIPLPKEYGGRIIHGNGWVLELAEGWTLVPGARPQDRTVAKQ